MTRPWRSSPAGMNNGSRKRSPRCPRLRSTASVVTCVASLGSFLGAEASWFPPELSSHGGVCVAPAVEPLPRSEAEEEHRRAVDHALAVFWSSKGGFGIDAEEEAAITRAGIDGLPEGGQLKIGHRPSTYGEVTPTGVRQIGRAMGMDNFTSGSIAFMDLGSGVGRFVVQAHLEWPNVASAHGVELSPTRAARASKAWRELETSGEAAALRSAALALAQDVGGLSKAIPKGTVSLTQGDLFVADVGEITHAFVASLCFNDAMLSRLAKKLEMDAPKLQAITSLRPFRPDLHGFLPPSRINAEMSWTKTTGGSQVYVYRRQQQHQHQHRAVQ